MNATRPLTVMEGYAGIVATTNPYLVQLDRALRATDGLTVLTYDPRRALTARYDVLHLHWPENLFGGHTRRGRWARRLLTTLLMLRLTVTRTPIVRTMHNLHRPSGLSRYDRRLLDWIDRRTAVQIRLNDDTDVEVGRATHTIPHGHYVDWFAPFPQPDARIGRLGFIGLIRRYKGVEDLLDAFARLDDPAASLRITGHPSSPELGHGVRDAAERDPRVSLRLEFVDDRDFAAEVCESAVVVMPYRHMHNSGVALAALSLRRPVLVPDTPVNRALGEEVGPGWVHLFTDRVEPDDLARALESVATTDLTTPPDLSARDWSDAGAAHLAAFRDALPRGRATRSTS